MFFKNIIEEINYLDDEEKFFLLGTLFSLLFSVSFFFYFYRKSKEIIDFSDIPFIQISFCYLNNLSFYFLSDVMIQEYMKLLCKINIGITILLILIYLIYQIFIDKIDALLNFLIIICSSWAGKKLLIDILNSEKEIKIVCGCVTLSLYLSMFEWISRALTEKNKYIINGFTPFTMLLTTGCWSIYGYIYDEFFFYIPNLVGFGITIIFIGCFLFIKFKYPEIEKKGEAQEINETKENKKNK